MKVNLSLDQGPLACQFFPLESSPSKDRIVGDKVYTIRRYICAHCGFKTAYTASLPDQILRECDVQDRVYATTMPSLVRRTLNYMKAYAQHAAVGRPESTPDQILSRLRVCVACPKYNPHEEACSLCGCYVNTMPANEGMNKLAWADTVCPDEPPRWLPVTQAKT